MENKKYILNGHNSFYLREGWLSKGYNLIKDKNIIPSSIFSKKNIYTIDELGLGSMMVQSVKFWMQLLGILIKVKATEFQLSSEAKIILEKDPYLQDNNSLWLLHLNIFNLGEDRAILWECIFEKDYNYNNFSKEALEAYIETYLKEKNISTSKKSLNDSINVFLKTYLYEEKKVDSPEDNLYSPFSNLRYLLYDNGVYKFRNIRHNEISEYIIYLIFFKYLNAFKKRYQLSITDGYKIVNKIIRMSYFDFEKIISRLELQGLIKVDRAGGLENIIFQNKNETSNDIIRKALGDEI